MVERTFNKHGLPEFFDAAEEKAARKAYIEACASGDQKKINDVLRAYPPLAGAMWKNYQPETTN